MSGSQKTLKVFGILEIISAAIDIFSAIQGGSVSSWVSVAASLLAGYLLIAAANDASKIDGAWTIVLVELVLSVASLALLFTGKPKGTVIAAAVVAIILNAIVFVAANNVKKQAGK